MIDHRWGHLHGHRERPRSPSRRPVTPVATAGLAGHVFFELAEGVGMPLASVVGPVPAAALWGAGTVTVWRAAATRPVSADGGFAVSNGAGLAAVIAPMSAWPRRRTRLGLPWLTDCEGLGADLMPLYNPILYPSAAAAIAALSGEPVSAGLPACWPRVSCR